MCRVESLFDWLVGRTRGSGTLFVLLVSLLAPGLTSAETRDYSRCLALAALSPDEPGRCTPRCRSGYYCGQGRCISLCNPPCPAGQTCTAGGECVSVVPAGRPTRPDYFAVFFAYRAGLGGGAHSTADVRLELGGKHLAVQIGPGFGDGITALRSALLGHVPFRPFPAVPFYLVPTIAFGYTHNWLNDELDTRQHQLFITPGLRLRYDVVPRLALFANVLDVEINFLRMENDSERDVERVSKVPVHWQFSVGAAFLY